MKTRRISLQLPRILLVALLFLFLCSCESNDAQIAALASSQAQLATQIALLATAQPQQATLIADQATRVASSLQIAQLSSTQAQQATQIAGQVTVISNVDQIARLSTLQAQLATLQAQQATQMAGQATRLANTNEIDQLSSAQGQQATEIANHVSWISHLSTRIPPRELPGNLTPASPTAYRPVDGSATIEDGRCCAGGVAGETIEVTINLGAFSPMAAVTEMRILSGGLQFEENDMIAAEWEPFVTSKRLPVQVALNWTGFNVSVQFRDAAGNLSRVAHDDIAIEGHPARPTP